MTMQAMRIAEPGAPFEHVELPIPEPGAGQVRVHVEACGICHSDLFAKEGVFPGIEYPRVPGHEVVGVVDAVGKGVSTWKAGDRVGIGWHGGHCFTCDPCRDGDFIMCEGGKITGISYDGGYAEYTVAPAEALARVPDGLSSEHAAPLLCAGITVYNALRNSGAQPGDLVAVQGIGGLGHLGVQYARRMGFETVAISSTSDKKSMAKELGAHHFVASKERNPAEALQGLGGARVILATAPHTDAINQVVGGLGRNGRMVVVAAANDPIEVSPMQLIMTRGSVSGWPSGHARDSEETLRFSALAGVRPMIETFPLEQANEAYDKMLKNEIRFRAVLVP